MALRFSAGVVAGIALLIPGVAAAQFAPVVDAPYRHTQVEERRDDRATQHFESRRTLVFHRLPNGFALDVTIVAASEPNNAAGAMFATAMAGLKGRTIRFLIDAKGHITGLEDEDSIWAMLSAAVDRAAASASPGSAARKQAAGALAAAFRLMPADRRRAILMSIAAPVLAGPLSNRGAVAQAPITIPARGPAGTAVTLSGHETVDVIDDQTLTITANAEGNVPSPPTPGSAETTQAHIRVKSTKRIDRIAGLVTEAREDRETTIGSGPTLRRATSTTISRLE